MLKSWSPTGEALLKEMLETLEREWVKYVIAEVLRVLSSPRGEVDDSQVSH